MQCDQVGVLQQVQVVVDVDGIVGDGDFGFIGQIGQGVVFVGIQVEVGEDVSLYVGQFEFFVVYGIGQVIVVLVVVQVDVVGIQCDVGCGLVVEFDDLYIQVLFFGFFGGDFYGVGEDVGDYVDFEWCGQDGICCGQVGEQYGEFQYLVLGE